MTTAISNIFSLLSSCYTVVTGNPLLTILVGMSISALIFGLLMSIFKPRRGRGR